MHYLMSFVRNGRAVTFPFIYDEDMFNFAISLPEEEWRNATYYLILGAETLKDMTDDWVEDIEYELERRR